MNSLGLDPEKSNFPLAAERHEFSEQEPGAWVLSTTTASSVFEAPACVLNAQIYIGRERYEKHRKKLLGGGPGRATEIVDGVVDSGANSNCSGAKQHFKIITDKKVRVRTAGGVLSEPGFVGVFRRNSHDLEYGIYHPLFKELLISVKERVLGSNEKLKSDCEEVVFGRRGSYIQLCDNRRRMIEWESGLPRSRVIFDLSDDGVDESRGMDGKSSEVVSNLDEDVDGLYCPVADDNEEVQDVDAHLSFSKLSAKERQDLHERHAHFHIKGLKVSCDTCALMKGGRGSVGKARGDHHKARAFLDCVDWDFTGPYPESQDKYTWALSAIDQFIDWVEVYPTRSKTDAGEAVAKYIRTVGLVRQSRSDNDPVFRGDDSKYVEVLSRQHPPVLLRNSVPYVPAQNGKVERWHSTMKSAMRCLLAHVDSSLWPWCVRFISYTWNRTARGKVKSPFERRFGRAPATSHFRKFGTLA